MRKLCQCLGLLAVLTVFAFSGCASNQMFSPLSAPAAASPNCSGGGNAGYS